VAEETPELDTGADPSVAADSLWVRP
jgi:hypothetical protein